MAKKKKKKKKKKKQSKLKSRKSKKKADPSVRAAPLGMTGAKGKAAARQEAFSRAYSIDLNATQAAITAGYSKRTAYAAGARLLKNVKVQAMIAELKKEQASKLGLSADRVLGELMLMGFANMEDYIRISDEGDAYIDLSKLTREQASAIQQIEVEEYTEGREENQREIRRTKLKLHARCRPLELMGKHLKLFIDRVEVPGLNELATALAAARQRGRA